MDTLIDLNRVKPDINQPRKIFSPEHIEGLAQSLRQEGMINPIEVDEEFIIITGECRWRAAQFLNWEKVPVNINKSGYSEYERLRHQMAENVHQSGTAESIAMNAIDVAKAYARMFKLKTGKDVVTDTLSFKERYGHIKEIADEIGVTSQTIGDYLKLLDVPEFIQKDIEEGRPRTYYEAARYAPIEFREEIKKKISKGEFESRPKLQEFIRVARTTPELAKIQLQQQFNKTSVATNRILNGIVRLALALEALPLEEINPKEKNMVIAQLEWLQKEISGYIQ